MTTARELAATARDLMTTPPVWIGETDSVLTAAIRMGELDVGALPICSADLALRGMLTDRDIVVSVLARRLDPAKIIAAQLANGNPVTVEVDADVETVLAEMTQHRIRRLPVVDHGALVGMIACGDVARALDERKSGQLLQAVSSWGPIPTSALAAPGPTHTGWRIWRGRPAPPG